MDTEGLIYWINQIQIKEKNHPSKSNPSLWYLPRSTPTPESNKNNQLKAIEQLNTILGMINYTNVAVAILITNNFP